MVELPTVTISATRTCGSYCWCNDVRKGFNRPGYFHDNPYYAGTGSGIATWQAGLAHAELVLDLIGMTEIPVVSQAADLLAGGVAALRGDYAGASLSMGAMVPGIGSAATVTKWGRRGVKVVSGADEAVATTATAIRNAPGTASGSGTEIAGKWLRGTNGNAGLFPSSVAAKLNGQTFTSFSDFRQAFWKAVADDPELAGQFSKANYSRMKSGAAPIALPSQWLGGQKSYILHHQTPINQGGAVYNFENLLIVTPRYHKDVLSPIYHYGN